MRCSEHAKTAENEKALRTYGWTDGQTLLKRCFVAPKNNGHPDTTSATPQPSATHSDLSATPSLSTPSTPSVSYKYKGHPGGDIHSAVLPKRGPLNI